MSQPKTGVLYNQGISENNHMRLLQGFVFHAEGSSLINAVKAVCAGNRHLYHAVTVSCFVGSTSSDEADGGQAEKL